MLAELWRSDSAMTPQEVRDRLPGDLAYTTVMTILTRLHEKGLAVRERDGRAFRYRPAQDAAEFAALRMQEALEAGTDREAVLTRFATSLSAADTRVLAAALQRARRPSLR